MSQMPPPPPPPPPDRSPASAPTGAPPVAAYGAMGASGSAPSRPLGKRRSKGLVVLLTIVTCGVWAIVWAYQNGDELEKWSGRGLGGVVHLVVTILLPPVTMFLLAGEVEQRYRDIGREPPISTLWGLWFLLPLIGNLIWYVRIQDAINDYWTMYGQTNDPGL
ncbi:MAG: DUF4234 domain-containing protein [Ilumatobacter sp.]|nr:DUF4234 domain-containing protein [Ilumatobacter sp.]